MTKGARPNFTFTSESESKILTNRSLQRSSLGKIDPLRGNPAPSPTVPLLQCPHGPSMPRFSPPLQKMVMVGKGNEDPPRCRCSLVTKTVMMAPLLLLRLAGLRERAHPASYSWLTLRSL